MDVAQKQKSFIILNLIVYQLQAKLFHFLSQQRNFSCLSQLGKSLSVRSARLLNCCNCSFLSEDIEKAISFSYEQDVSVVIFETVIRETRRATCSF